MRGKWLLLFSILFWPVSGMAKPVTVTDLAGRNVTLNAPATRIILADSRMLLTMSLLHPGDALKGIVAWDDSLKTRAPDMARYFARQYPRLSDIPVFINPYRSTFSVEQAMTLKPDLVVFDIGILAKLRGEGTLALLEKSGIPVIFIDFRHKPLTNTPVSLRLLGTVTGETQNAERFIQRWNQLLARTQERIAAIPQDQWPGVVFENHAGMSGMNCCAVFGRDSFGEFIPAAGGRNLIADKVPPQGADISPELLIVARPDIYLMSGADWSQRGRTSLAVPLGYDATRATTLPRLQALMQRPMLSVLPVANGHRVMAIYHQFYDSPFNVVALEAMAKLFHPQSFADVDPQADLEALYRDFVGMPYRGLFFIQL
ncbi:ABC transporter substrate-binding protein [Rahnella sp. SL6]|uniref:ABC transporter substrate-binding protein n=1 Tax=Rahnella perminowiae TaxID=2816244 RepID=UPI001C25AEA3|nr:ABC transporter substrate-binding protein [Rahnella perminowiae]MBU9810211.1 ABC transporter substrate-binding protein [Rahnella perminowiae]